MKNIINIALSIILSLPFLHARSLYQRGDSPPPAKVTVQLDGPGTALIKPGSTHGDETPGGTVVNWPGPGHFQQTYEHPTKIQAWAQGTDGSVGEVHAVGRKTEAVISKRRRGDVGEVQAIGKKKRLKQLGSFFKPTSVRARATKHASAEARASIRGKGSAWAGATNKGPSPQNSPPHSPRWSTGSGSTSTMGRSSTSEESTSSGNNRDTSASSPKES